MNQSESSRAKSRDPVADRKGTNTGSLGFARDDGEQDAQVPLFGSWRNAYLVAIAAFVVDVIAFYAISRYFA